MPGKDHDEFVSLVFGKDPSTYPPAEQDDGQAAGPVAASSYDADAFYQQALQDSGYTLGGNDCLDRCWADFQRCTQNSTSGGLECLAQLSACQRGRGPGDGGSSGGQLNAPADDTTGGTPAFDADAFYQKTLQDSGYTLGGNDCLDRCWADFQTCTKNSTSGGLECLAQLSACQRACGTAVPDSSGGTPDQATSLPGASGAQTGEQAGQGAGEGDPNEVEPNDDPQGGASGGAQPSQPEMIQVTIVTTYSMSVKYWIQDLGSDPNLEAQLGQGVTLVDGDEHGPNENIALTCTKTPLGGAIGYTRASDSSGGGVREWHKIYISENSTGNMEM